MDFVNRLAVEFKLRPQQVQAAVELLDAGNTIPFIARYRKEATGSLDDQVLREMAERLEYLRNLEKRREEIAASLEEQGVLTDELKAQLAKAVTLSELEDIYRPFRPKRRTRATVAKERGLEPLALWLMLQQAGDPAAEAAKYIDPEKEVPDAETALAGARDILAETVSDSAEIRKELRALLNREGVIRSRAAKEEDSVYSMYYDFREPVRTGAGGDPQSVCAHQYAGGAAGIRSLRGRVGTAGVPVAGAGDPERPDRPGKRQRDQGVQRQPAPAADAAADQGQGDPGRGPGFPDRLQAGGCG